jgi:hypothetical protein
MKNKLILIFLLLCSFAEADQYKEVLKTQILTEMDFLQADLKSTHSKINQLRIGKKNLEQSLKNMEEWGLKEQREKLIYYREKIEAEALLEEEKTSHIVTKNRYLSLKKLAGYISAGLFMFAYFALLAPGVAQLAPFTGPWGFLLRLGSPAFAAALGYYSAQIFL